VEGSEYERDARPELAEEGGNRPSSTHCEDPAGQTGGEEVRGEHHGAGGGCACGAWAMWPRELKESGMELGVWSLSAAHLDEKLGQQ